ncbi:hypothetical protein DEU56DRAFT_561274 [Suillus clintonianus]|uniref:uncharacterized protein n=1 Tax=Suillus clintonianus TaxID=1904413 RepID=UPI001B87F65E|nr:uncharacterized protein DEU56DRAFT_561274 [Suillus clintonianus]KAG2125990.1 hypothetical protein DEU56DRAFT_561274 [Suillus clintonianus]
MDTFALPQSPRSSSPYLWEHDPDVDVSFHDGRFTGTSEVQTLPRGLYYPPPIDIAHTHAGSQEHFNGPPLIDVRAWGTASNQPYEGFTYNSPLVPNHWQHGYLPLADHEYPASDNFMYRSPQSEWTTSPVDVLPPSTSFGPGPTSPSIPSASHVPPSVDQDLHNSDEMFCCPLLSSDGTCCNAHIPCNETDITTHLRSVHALRAKRLEVITCPWPRCECRMQAASIPRHIITLHVKARFQCSYCGKSLTRKDGKLKHEKICHGKP